MARRSDVADEFFDSLKMHMNETLPVHVVVIALDDDERKFAYNFDVVFLWATSDTGVVLDRSAKQFPLVTSMHMSRRHLTGERTQRVHLTRQDLAQHLLNSVNSWMP